MTRQKKRRLAMLAWTAAGSLGGYLYYRLVGCSTGLCPITSNPLLTTLYGGEIGWLLSVVFAPRAAQRKKTASE